MSLLKLPKGFVVVQLDNKRWYPIQVERTYSAENPEGSITLMTLINFKSQDYEAKSFVLRSDAVFECQRQAQEDEFYQRWGWEQKAKDWNEHPDRCIHYREVIEEVTGVKPVVMKWSKIQDASVLVKWGPCWQCGRRHSNSFFVDAPTIEEALEEAAQRAYATQSVCVLPVEKREQVTVSV